VPLSDHNALAATLIAVFDDWQRERWNLVRLAEDLRRQNQQSKRAKP